MIVMYQVNFVCRSFDSLSLAQGDTVLLLVMLIKAHNHNNYLHFIPLQFRCGGAILESETLK